MTTAVSRIRIWTLALALLCHVPLWADGPETGTLSGSVRDAQGEALPGVTVTLAGSQNTRTVVSKDDGTYRFALLQSGRYTLGAALEGLGSTELAVDLSSGQHQDVDLTLQGATAETITVTSEAPMVSKFDVAVTQSISAEMTENVGYATRTYNAAVRQLPAVVNRNNNDQVVSMNGGISNEVGVFVEGVDTSMSRRGGELRMLIPGTSITETKVEAAGFGVEYGRATSGIINSTIKTGTNTFHGDFLYIGQNPKWRAPNQLGLERKDEQINSFETSLGGPIYRDKAWFFASYANMSDNRLDETPDGTVHDTSDDTWPLIGKVNFQPGQRHHVAVTAIDFNTTALSTGANPGDQYAILLAGLNGRLQTATWSFSITDSTLIEVKASNREELLTRDSNAVHPIDPTARVDDPAGNAFRYRDLDDGLIYNDLAVALGEGYNDFPRDQANAAVTLFRGDHELKLGADVQDIEFGNLADIGAEYRGRGYCLTCPGGYTQPTNKRTFDPSPVITLSSVMSAAFVQDRFSVGDHFTFTAGVRADSQTIDNEVGERVNEYTEVAPRLSVVYDLEADGRFLLRGTAGRYYRNIGLGIVLQEFTRSNNGANVYTQTLWNPATRLYDRSPTRVEPAFDQVIQDVDPYYKDEVSAGFDWQFAPVWVWKTRAVASESDHLFHATLQYDAAGQVIRDLRNWPDARREHRSLTFEVNRAFRQGWSLQSNWTWGKTEGNQNSFNDDFNLYEGLGGVEVGTGVTNATSNGFWFGDLVEHRDHIVNVVGMKRFSFGQQDLVFGSFLHWDSGEPWGLHPSTTLAHPVSGQTITTATYREPVDAHTLDDQLVVNLSATWSIPIRGPVVGILGLDVSNLFDQQDVVGINRLNGEPEANITAYQYPRELRLKAGFRF